MGSKSDWEAMKQDERRAAGKSEREESLRRCELDVTRVDRGGGNPPELRCPQRWAWLGKDRVVENVEELRAELGAEALAEMPVLGQREVEIAEA